MSLALLMVLGAATFAGVSDTGAYFGVAQTFAGSTDSYIGYTFGNAAQTSAFSVQFNVADMFGTTQTPSFLINSTLGFGLLYEYSADALDLDIYLNTTLNDTNDAFASWASGARAEFLVLPNPCDTPGPCYNPELKIFAEVRLSQVGSANPAIWGEVGFEVHL